MQRSDSIVELAKALLKAQAQFQAAQMNSINPFLKNRYADLGSVIEAVRPALAGNGLAFMQFASASGAVVSVETALIHESGEYISETLSLVAGEERGKSLAQVTGSVITYLRRYGLSAMLGVYSDEDTDGNDAQQPRGRQQAGVAPAQSRKSTTPPPPDAEVVGAEEAEDGEGKPPHWIDDRATQKKFWAWVGSLGMDSDAVHAALGVQSVRDFAGDKEAAIEKIKACATKQTGEQD